MRFHWVYTQLSTLLYLKTSIVDSFAYWTLKDLLQFQGVIVCCTTLTNELPFRNELLSLTNGTNTQCQREFWSFLVVGLTCIQTYIDVVVLVVIAKENEHVLFLDKIFTDENTWEEESGFDLELRLLRLLYKMEE
jgi:hypothetical protein